MPREGPDAESGLTARELLDHLSRPGYEPLPQRELLHRLQVPGDERSAARRLIRRLLDEGRMVKLSRGRLAAPRPERRVTGRLSRHPDGFGFVVPEDGGDDVYVGRRDLGAARTGDRVIVRVIRRGRSQRLAGVLEQILEREQGRFLALYLAEGRSGAVLPLDPAQAGERIPVPRALRGPAKHEHVVEAERVESNDRLEAKVVDDLGHLDEPGTDVAVVSRQYSLRTSIPRPVLDAAEALPSRIGPRDKRRRERFDDPPPVTIDGETAQDFDDAIAVERRAEGGFRLYVHIADVGHFVEPDSVLDREAQLRGTSVYFPGTVLPMFPEKLSNDLCSLRPGVDRLVQSAVLEIDARGKTRGVRFADGVICSAARLTYTQVARVLERGAARGVPKKLAPMLKLADELRAVLEQRRAARGAVDLDLPVPRILLDVEGAMTGITIEPRNRAHQLIEECMLAANEAVAAHLERHNAPCMYRIHEQPDPAKLETLARFVESLGFELPADLDVLDGVTIRHVLEETEGRPEAPLVSALALRSMKQARYSMENHGHFGLAAPTYCHFTSPIRRYPDLVVHRLLRRQRRRAKGELDVAGLETLAEACSELERKAESAERDVLAWKKIAFIQGQEGEEFDGLVAAVTRFGLFVQLTENLVEGLVKVDQLGPDYFAFDEHRQELRGERTGTAFRLGDRLRVRVERVDRVLRRVDLSLVGRDPALRNAPKGGRGKRHERPRRRIPGRHK